MDFTVRPATSAQWLALEDLFGRPGASNGCWCMYWRIGPRYRDRPRTDNQEDLRQLAASGRPPGQLAFDGDRAVGWCELAPRAELAWLARTRYLGPVDDLPVWSVPCFYVRASHRGRGVMDALIDAAAPAAAAAGAPALEAYPVDTTVPSHTGNLFPGIAAAFARQGFQVVARRKPDGLRSGGFSCPGAIRDDRRRTPHHLAPWRHRPRRPGIHPHRPGPAPGERAAAWLAAEAAAAAARDERSRRLRRRGRAAPVH